MVGKALTFGVSAILLCSILFLTGCSDINRKHFTTLQPTRVENGNQHFQFKASTGSSILTCAPGSKNCRTDGSGRTALWPLEDKEAEKTRIEWLEKNLAEQGYEGAEYEIVSREPILAASSVYDVSYDVRMLLRH